MDFLNLIIKNLVENKAETVEDLAKAKRLLAKKHKVSLPSNIQLLKAYHSLVNKKRIKKSEKIESILKTRPIRSLAGIVNISVLTKPYSCPGRCLYCPEEKGIPKSYLSGEPAVERAKKLNFNPYLQVEKRIEMLKEEGHPTDKIELRIVGETWSYYPKQYQNQFIKECFLACNNFSKKKINKKIGLKRAQQINQKAKQRIIGLSIETRPDFINQKEIKRLRNFGVTMVELGVQSTKDKVLENNLRGHGRKEIISATKKLKDAGFKILYQVMPNLAGSTIKKDKEVFVELFNNPDFQPDLLKIYPCALIKETPLYKLWKRNKYKTYSENELISLVKDIKKIIPPYVRIQRISRDIPSGLIVAGPAKISNLRQILEAKMKKEGWQCQCIRCREVREKYFKKEKIYLTKREYLASQGKEIFLTFEDKEKTKLYSLLRLRLTSENKSIVREVHTYGQAVPINQKKYAAQHQGMGKKLIKEAEKITKNEFKLNKISIISGVGAREYFKKLGYRLENTYMVKSLK